MLKVSRPNVIVDTNIVFGDFLLNGKEWTELRRLAERNLIHLVVPEVVILETARQWAVHATKALKTFYNSRQAIAKLLHGVQPALRSLPSPPDPRPAADRDAFITYIQGVLEDAAAEVPGYKHVSQERLLARDLAGRKPFDDRGRGYRDALIWETLLHLVGDSNGDQITYFLTNDGDFRAKEGGLYPELQEELGAAASRVVVVAELRELLEDHLQAQRQTYAEGAAHEVEQFDSDGDDWEDDDPRTREEIIEAAVIRAAEDLVGTDIDDATVATSTTALSQLELPRGPDSYDIGSIMVDETSVDIQVYDRLEGDTLLAEASVWAQIEFHGYIYKGNFYLLEADHDFSVLDFDWNERYMLVAVTRDCKLYFQVRMDAHIIEYVDLEHAELEVEEGEAREVSGPLDLE